MEQVAVADIDLYDGALGQTLIIVIRERHDLEQLREAMSDLARLAPLSNRVVSRSEGAMIEIKSSQVRRPEISQLSEVPLRVTWSQSQDQWDHNIGLVDGLLRNDSGGHQYLTEGRNSVLVLLSYKEPDVEKVG